MRVILKVYYFFLFILGGGNNDLINTNTYRKLSRKEKSMSDLKQRILKEEIKMFFISENKLAIYGKTYEVRNELKNAGAIWNPKRKRLELDEENFKKLDNEIIEKTFELRDKQREMSIEKISHLLKSKELVAIKNENDNYVITSNVKDFKRELYYSGFSLIDENYTISSEEFEKIFPNEVKEVVNEYNNNKGQEIEEKQEEIIYEENEEQEAEY